MKKPELLLPVGNIESFYAAIDGGADAIYLGLPYFNARNRAKNFSIHQLIEIIRIANEKKINVYITLNTVIKNEELPQLLNTLFMLSQLKIKAVIIQDWGVYYLIRKHFPNIPIHASTQMGIHNALGTEFAKQKGFQRVILARELTKNELAAIAKKSNVELEIFVHGALCYSFSGMCLFSSYLGGNSANRGLCKQPCRRFYDVNKNKKLLFNLKDNELIDLIPFFSKLNITSLKIEGRMRTSEYVYRAAKAYRMALDDFTKLNQAKILLSDDLGREKTSYFMAGKLNQALFNIPNTGKYIGNIESIKPDSFIVRSEIKVHNGDRLAVFDKNGNDKVKITVNKTILGDGVLSIYADTKELKQNDAVFLSSIKNSFPDKIKTNENKSLLKQLPKTKIQNILSVMGSKPKLHNTILYLRISSLRQLKTIDFKSFQGILINFSKLEWANYDEILSLTTNYKDKIYIELPKFISETSQSFYVDLCKRLSKKGYQNFSISHLSQKLIIPDNSNIISNENVYIFNDAAVKLIKSENIKQFIYPLEIDFPNLLRSKTRDGIIPMFFYPNLFYSRMPINKVKEDFYLDKLRLRLIKRNGTTIVIPENPVSFTQYKAKLERIGYNSFLFDISFNRDKDFSIDSILNSFKISSKIEHTSSFNFKMEIH